MASIRLQIRDAAVAKLEGAGLPAGATVHKRRTLPLDPAAIGPVGVMAVYLLPETVLNGAGGYMARRSLTLRVECRVVATPALSGADADADLDAKLDPLTTHAVRALLADPRLDKLAIDVAEQGTQYETADGEHLIGGAAVDFLVDYATLANDPEATK